MTGAEVTGLPQEVLSVSARAVAERVRVAPTAASLFRLTLKVAQPRTRLHWDADPAGIELEGDNRHRWTACSVL